MNKLKDKIIMADTKKEHYVPRCYLRNFTLENEKIQVFDKYKVQVRPQNIMDVAMENYFYDIKFNELIKLAEEDEMDRIKADLMEIAQENDWGKILDILDEKYIEKHFSFLEGVYSKLSQRFIENSYNGNEWVIKNCFAFSEMDKELMSLFIAIQIIRTKTFRCTLADTIQKLYQTMAYKMQTKSADMLSKDDFEVEVNRDFVKLQHSSMILDEEVAVGMAEVLNEHIWVMYVNKTNTPFYTSDTPVANIPHKYDEYMGYGGLRSEGIEIVFPLTPNLMIGMYERSTYSAIFSDRQFVVLTTKEQIEYYNRVQVINSYRCVFSSNDSFDLAKRMCDENPDLRHPQSRVQVS